MRSELFVLACISQWFSNSNAKIRSLDLFISCFVGLAQAMPVAGDIQGPCLSTKNKVALSVLFPFSEGARARLTFSWTRRAMSARSR